MLNIYGLVQATMARAKAAGVILTVADVVRIVQHRKEIGQKYFG